MMSLVHGTPTFFASSANCLVDYGRPVLNASVHDREILHYWHELLRKC